MYSIRVVRELALGLIFAFAFIVSIEAVAAGVSTASGSNHCARSVKRVAMLLGEGHGPGTNIEDAVVHAALTGDIAELNRRFRHLRNKFSRSYRVRWLDIALNYAVRAGQKAAVVFLLHQGAQINERGFYMQILQPGAIGNHERLYLDRGGNPLANAVACRRPLMVDFLLQRGADMYASATGFHPTFAGNVVYAAVGSGAESLVDVFLKRGLDPCKVIDGPYTLAELAKKVGLPPEVQSQLKCVRRRIQLR